MNIPKAQSVIICDNLWIKKEIDSLLNHKTKRAENAEQKTFYTN